MQADNWLAWGQYKSTSSRFPRVTKLLTTGTPTKVYPLLDLGVCFIILCHVKIKIQTNTNKSKQTKWWELLSFPTPFLNYLYLRPTHMPTKERRDLRGSSNVLVKRWPNFIITLALDPRTVHAPNQCFVNIHRMTETLLWILPWYPPSELISVLWAPLNVHLHGSSSA